MDDIVRRGMARWPNVPAVYGWLALDRRGNWLIKGDRIANSGVTEFIGRNYGHDERGCWYFQNGPQRVFVSLDYAPFVYRVVSPPRAPLALEAHHGKPVTTIGGAWVDEGGTVLLQTEHGVGTIYDRDLERLLTAFTDANGVPLADAALDATMETLQRGRVSTLWLSYRDASIRVEPIASRQVAGRFGFVARPEPPAGEEVCR